MRIFNFVNQVKFCFAISLRWVLVLMITINRVFWLSDGAVSCNQLSQSIRRKYSILRKNQIIPDSDCYCKATVFNHLAIVYISNCGCLEGSKWQAAQLSWALCDSSLVLMTFFFTVLSPSPPHHIHIADFQLKQNSVLQPLQHEGFSFCLLGRHYQKKQATRLTHLPNHTNMHHKHQYALVAALLRLTMPSKRNQQILPLKSNINAIGQNMSTRHTQLHLSRGGKYLKKTVL